MGRTREPLDLRRCLKCRIEQMSKLVIATYRDHEVGDRPSLRLVHGAISSCRAAPRPYADSPLLRSI